MHNAIDHGSILEPPAPLLHIKQFSLHIAPIDETQAYTPLLHQIDLTLQEGETHALVGESGSGKTVTALSILRLLEENTRIQTSGTIMLRGQDLYGRPLSAMRSIRGNDIAMIFQEPMIALNPVYTIGNQVIEAIQAHQNISAEQAREEAIALLDRTGIVEPAYRLNSYPHQLSGGQRQRVMIAMALACQPTLLIADEPTTALDISIQNQILDLLKSIQQEYGMTVLLITHDLPMVKRIAETVTIMQHGRIVEQGRVDQIFSAPEQAYTKQLLAAIPSGEKTSFDSVHGEGMGSSAPLLHVERIQCTFAMKQSKGLFRIQKRHIAAVDQVSLHLHPGTTLGIVGESGSGKSTLAMCILNLERYTGHNMFRGQNGEIIPLHSLRGKAMRSVRRELQIVFQDPYSSLSPRMTVGQIVAEGLKVHKLYSSAQERDTLVEQALHEVDLPLDSIQRFPHEFSGGQRQRIAIARAIILKPRLLILDEPTSALDMTIQKQILELLLTLQKRYAMSFIFISHDLRAVRTMADTLAVMRAGKIVEFGPAHQIFTAPQEAYTRQLMEAVFH